MTTYKSFGGCHCGNITFDMLIAHDPGSYKPLACDCDFCSKHGAAYLSDKQGKLMIFVKTKTCLSQYQQGSGIVDFLICSKCGVLVAVCYAKQGRLYAAINSKAVDRRTRFGREIVVSPEKLSDHEKIQLWQNTWFPEVSITYA